MKRAYWDNATSLRTIQPSETTVRLWESRCEHFGGAPGAQLSRAAKPFCRHCDKHPVPVYFDKGWQLRGIDPRSEDAFTHGLTDTCGRCGGPAQRIERIEKSGDLRVRLLCKNTQLCRFESQALVPALPDVIDAEEKPEPEKAKEPKPEPPESEELIVASQDAVTLEPMTPGNLFLNPPEGGRVEVNGPLRLKPLAEAPTELMPGMMYFDKDSGSLVFMDGGGNRIQIGSNVPHQAIADPSPAGLMPSKELVANVGKQWITGQAGVPPGGWAEHGTKVHKAIEKALKIAEEEIPSNQKATCTGCGTVYNFRQSRHSCCVKVGEIRKFAFVGVCGGLPPGLKDGDQFEVMKPHVTRDREFLVRVLDGELRDRKIALLQGYLARCPLHQAVADPAGSRSG